MTTPPNNLLQTPASPSNRKSPREYVALVGEYVKSLAALMFWLLVGAASLAGMYLGLKLLWFALNSAIAALGLE